MIEIKGFFGDWQWVDVEKARSYVMWLKHNITAIPCGQRDAYINEKHLRGATVETLTRGGENE